MKSFKISCLILFSLIVIILGCNLMELITMHFHPLPEGCFPARDKYTIVEDTYYNLCFIKKQNNYIRERYDSNLEDIDTEIEQGPSQELIDIVDELNKNNIKHFSIENIKRYIISLIELIILLFILNLIAYLILNKKNKILMSVLFIISIDIHYTAIYSKYLLDIYLKSIKIPNIIILLLIIILNVIITYVLYRCKQLTNISNNRNLDTNKLKVTNIQ